jgi:hypothetical protein
MHCPPALLLLALAVPLLAQGKGGIGDLMVMPTRVVLEGRDRSAEVLLRNAGKGVCSYRVYFQEMRMLPTGAIEVIPKPEGSLTAADLVRFTPRQVQLGPGESQVVLIHLRLMEGVPEGEYRSHLVFQGLTPVDPPKPVLEDQLDEKTLAFDIKTMVSLSIPIIVRHGETHVEVALSQLVFHSAASPGGVPSLDLQMERKGNRSAQGEFKVDWLPASGRPRTVLPVLGGTIYTCLDSRSIHMDLSEGKGVEFKGGRLKVTFAFKDVKQVPVVSFLDLP